jgi:hypothetical protein
VFSFENGLDIEMVPDASEFLEDTLNIWDTDHALDGQKTTTPSSVDYV